MFIDKAHIVVTAGTGGDGCLSFRREKYVEMGGPDGANGGHGGDVYIVADGHLSTLIDFAYKPNFKAPSGGHGQSSNKTGRSGEDLIIRMPPGTLVYKNDKLLSDLKSPGDQCLVAKGGRGGRGNMSFKTSVNTAPHIAENGEAGETAEIRLELKLLADVGLAGFPNAGKSTLLSHISAARPKIGDYPFTTLTPNLGMVRVHKRSFVVADIPGLIEGAHTGKGLGDEFLRHIERTRVIVHLVDAFGFDGKTAYQNYQALNKELSSYSAILAKKPQIIAFNKMDLTGSAKALADFKKKVKKIPVFPVSAATGKGLKELLNAVLKRIDQTPETPAFTPSTAHVEIETDFEVTREDERFRVSGKKIERLIQMTNFRQDEAVRRLQKIFQKMGVEKALTDEGAARGDQVIMGNYEFTFRPE